MDVRLFCEAALGEHRAGNQQDKTGNEEDLIALGGALGLLVLLLRRDLTKEAAVDGPERRLGRPRRRERHIASLARLRDRLQRRLLELHLDGLPLELLLAATILGRNRRTMLRIADPDGEDRNAALLRQLGVGERLAAQVATVGDEDDRVVVIRRRIKRIK